MLCLFGQCRLQKRRTNEMLYSSYAQKLFFGVDNKQERERQQMFGVQKRIQQCARVRYI